jgi:cytochrome c oxidase cbb3-type subunit 3
MSPEREDNRLLDHDYDGIKEYDNPMPRWWLYIFYASIVYAVLYVLNVPGIGSGAGRLAAYQREMKVMDSVLASHDPLRGITEAALLAVARDGAKHELGKATFSAMCSSCHRADAGGNIGPNLTDAWWLHGGTPLAILSSVNQGVLEKGMPAWGKMLKPDQLIAVVGYVTTLQGSNPKDPKPPQGVRADSAAALPAPTER